MRNLTEAEMRHVSGGGGQSSCDSWHKEKGNNGYGNGGHDGVPGNSNKQDKTR